MRLLVTGALALAASLAMPLSAGAQALTGQMVPYSYLIGAAWNCTTNVPAMMGQPAHTDQGTATFEVVPGNVVHNHVATPTYAGDFYFGYSTRMSSFWQTVCGQLRRARVSDVDGRKGLHRHDLDGAHVLAGSRHLHKGSAEQGDGARRRERAGPPNRDRQRLHAVDG